MENELYVAFNSIQVEKLSEDDKEELLRLFEASKNRVVFTQIAFIFSLLNYTEAVPSIIKKINNKEFYNKNGSLVYALGSMDVTNYFYSFVKIICDQAYMARMEAYRIIRKIAPHASIAHKRKALNMLDNTIKKIKSMESSPEIESRLEYMLGTKEIIEQSIKDKPKQKY